MSAVVVNDTDASSAESKRRKPRIAKRQFAAFASLFILIDYASSAFAGRRRRESWLFLWAVATLLATHAIMLQIGSTMIRGWADTEYRELLIAIGMFAGAVETASRLKPPTATPEALSVTRITIPRRP